jgi:hypothetical protein
MILPISAFQVAGIIGMPPMPGSDWVLEMVAPGEEKDRAWPQECVAETMKMYEASALD